MFRTRLRLAWRIAPSAERTIIYPHTSPHRIHLRSSTTATASTVQKVSQTLWDDDEISEDEEPWDADEISQDEANRGQLDVSQDEKTSDPHYNSAFPPLSEVTGTEIHLENLETQNWNLYVRNALRMITTSYRNNREDLYHRTLRAIEQRLVVKDEGRNYLIKLIYALINTGQEKKGFELLERFLESGTIRNPAWAISRLLSIAAQLRPEMKEREEQALLCLRLLKQGYASGVRFNEYRWKQLLTLFEGVNTPLLFDLFELYKKNQKPESIIFCNRMIKAFAERRNLSVALQVLDYIERETNLSPTELTFTPLISLHRKMGLGVDPLLEKMRRLGMEPNEKHMAAATLHAAEESPPPSLSNRSIASISNLMQHRLSVGDAAAIFDIYHRLPIEAPELKPDVVFYTILISTCIVTKDVQRALEFLRTMDEEHILPNEISYIQFFQCCCAAKDMQSALSMLSYLQENRRELISTKILNSYLQVCVQCDEIERAMHVYQGMKEGPKQYRPSDRTYPILLNMWAKAGNLVECKRLLSQIRPEEVKISAHSFLPLFTACEKSKDVIGMLNVVDLIKKNRITPITAMWNRLANVLYYHSSQPNHPKSSSAPPNPNGLNTTPSLPMENLTNTVVSNESQEANYYNDTHNTDNSASPAIIPIETLFTLISELCKEGYHSQMVYVTNQWIGQLRAHNNRTHNEVLLRETNKLQFNLKPYNTRWLQGAAMHNLPNSLFSFSPNSFPYKNKRRQPPQQANQQQQQQQKPSKPTTPTSTKTRT